ncbi:MAG: hypothetical protein WCF18_25250, partial [Chthoniobacteraceae bacterium]
MPADIRIAEVIGEEENNIGPMNFYRPGLPQKKKRSQDGGEILHRWFLIWSDRNSVASTFSPSGRSGSPSRAKGMKMNFTSLFPRRC